MTRVVIFLVGFVLAAQDTSPRLAAIRLPRKIAGVGLIAAYPEEAKQRGVGGTVELSARVDGDGNVVSVRVVKPLDSTLDEFAVRAVSTWRYQPAAFGGRTLKTTVQVAVPFLPGGTVVGAVFGGSSPPFNAPTGLATDAEGNVYVADAGRSLIYRVNAAGTSMSVFAGDASEGSKGDGGPASSAQLNVPYDLAIDTAGNLYVADTGNSRIRKITPGGTITTVAGSATAGFSGDGGAATAAQLNKPLGVAVDAAGVLYIADTDNSRIRRVSADGIIRTIADKLGFPYDVAVDAAGTIYVADPTSEKVLKVAPDGTLTTVTSEPIAALGVSTDQAGSLYITDGGSPGLRRIQSGVASPISLNLGTSALFSRAVVDPRGTLYVADGSGGFVWRIRSGITTSVPVATR